MIHESFCAYIYHIALLGFIKYNSTQKYKFALNFQLEPFRRIYALVRIVIRKQLTKYMFGNAPLKGKHMKNSLLIKLGICISFGAGISGSLSGEAMSAQILLAQDTYGGTVHTCSTRGTNRKHYIVPNSQARASGLYCSQAFHNVKNAIGYVCSTAVYSSPIIGGTLHQWPQAGSFSPPYGISISC